MSVRHLDRLLEPRSVAVIGASDRPGALGTTAWRHVRGGRFAGPIHAVNLHHASLDGEPVARRVRDLPQPPDLALLCTPAQTVPGLVAELGAAGTRAAIVMTPMSDAALRRAALEAARPHLLRLLGPGSLGLLSPRLGLNASLAQADPLEGDLAFVSQSGALVAAMLDWGHARRIGFSHLVSTGLGSDVDAADLLDVLASDWRTRAILLYLEQLEEGAARKFMSAARAAARNKPVIVVKAGRSPEALQAIEASHTRALVGSDAVFDAAVRRAGMLRVETLDELFVAAQTLARLRMHRGPGLVVMTNGGGGGVIAADAAARLGVPLIDVGSDAALAARLDALLPAGSARRNPIDLGLDATPERYREVLEALLGRRDGGAILFLHAPSAAVPAEDVARACAPLARGTSPRLLGCWLGEGAVAGARAVFLEAGVPDFATPEAAVRALALLATWRRNQETLLEVPALEARRPPDLAHARAAIAAALAEGREWLSEGETEALLADYGIPVAATRQAAPEPEAAVAAARELGHPVALKIASRAIQHKSDVGGVALDLRGDDEVRVAAQAMLQRVRALRPEARLEGFLLQRMVQRPQAHELIVGASLDPVFGPVLLFGAGGTAVEVLADRAVALPPLNRPLAAELVERTRIARLLAGYRERPPAAREAIHDVLVAVSQMLADLPEIAELDINPLLADAEGVLALDAGLRLSPARPAGAEHFAIKPYPEGLVQRFEWCGRTVTLRPIRPEDEAQHLAFLSRLDPEDVRMRLFQARRELPRSELARLTQIDYAREMAFVATAPSDDGGQETLGVVRAIADPDNVEAEFAIVVRSDQKGRGLGRRLMQRIIEYAREQGIQRLVGDVLRENKAMLGLALACGFEIDRARSDGEVVHLVLPLATDGATR